MNKRLNGEKNHHKSRVEAEKLDTLIAKTASWATFEACVQPDQVLATLESADIGWLATYGIKSSHKT